MKFLRRLGAGGNPWRADARPLGGAQMVDVETWLFFRNFDTIDIEVLYDILMSFDGEKSEISHVGALFSKI